MRQEKLTASTFKEQILSKGYFYEQIPQCFTTAKFAAHTEEVFALLDGKKPVTSPLTFSVYKTEEARRIIAIPNPWSFLSTVHTFASNWSACRKLAESRNSHSPITFFNHYDDLIGEPIEVELINSEAQRESVRARSSFVANLKERLVAALGRPYKLTIDLANFYSSIYTHSLTWSICGKEEAKRWFSIIANGQKKLCPNLEPKHYALADQIDSAIRRQKNNETNGILTGPYTSRIFSELLLCGIDHLLQTTKKESFGKLVFRRYVDDYSFYLRSEEEATQSLVFLEQTFHEFGLTINHAKVRIQRYPFDTLSNLGKVFSGAYESQGVFGLLNQAALLSEAGEKGAFKYALKWLSRKMKTGKIEQADLSMIVNIGITHPNCAALALSRVKESEAFTDSTELTDALNLLISKSLEYHHDHEALNGIFYCKELDLQISAENIVEAIRIGNDLCKIIALDYAKHRTEKIRGWGAARLEVQNKITALETQLVDENTDSGRWMLLFEGLNHGLLNVSLGDGATSDLMKELGKLKVSFYEGFTLPDFSWSEHSTTVYGPYRLLDICLEACGLGQKTLPSNKIIR